MGSIIGAGIGAVGSIIGGQQSAKAAKQSAMIQAAAADRAGERALTGYKYLTEGAGAAPMRSYIDAGQRALGNQGGVQNMMMDLLGVSGYMNSGGGGPAAPAAGGGGGGQPNALANGAQSSSPSLYPRPSDADWLARQRGQQPPYPGWYQQQSGQFAPGVAMPAAGEPPPQFAYPQNHNALNYYSIPGGGTISPDSYGGVQFGRGA